MKKSELDAVLAPLLNATNSLNTIAARQAQNPGGGGSAPQSQNPISTQLLNALATPFSNSAKATTNLVDMFNVKILGATHDPLGLVNRGVTNELISKGFYEGDIKNNIDKLIGDELVKLGVNAGIAAGELLTATMSMLVMVDTIKLFTNEIFKLFKQSFEEVSNFQIKALASNIKPIDVFSKTLGFANNDLTEFKNSLKSTSVEFQQELLKFRDVGITNLNRDVAKTIDRMLFTGQKVEKLASFMSSNAAAVGMNTDQATALAMQLANVADSFEIQKDTLFEVTQSIKEFSSKMAAIAPGLGLNIQKVMGTIVPQFKLNLSDSVKSMLSMFDPKNMVLMAQVGLGDIYEKIRGGTATAEDLKIASAKLVDFADKQLATQPGLVGDFTKTQFLKTFGIQDEALVAARLLKDAKLRVGGAKEVEFDTLKEITNTLKSQMQGFVVSLGDMLGESGFINIIKGIINSLAGSAKGMVQNFVKGIASDVSALPRGGNYEINVPGFGSIKIPKDEMEGMLRPVQSALQITKLQEAEQRQLQSVNPETQKVQEAQLAQLDQINQHLREANGLKKIEIARRVLLAPYEMKTA